ncbi:hypothetical protein OQA88_9918 [Cercophora sp. LCS_1]
MPPSRKKAQAKEKRNSEGKPAPAITPSPNNNNKSITVASRVVIGDSASEGNSAPASPASPNNVLIAPQDNTMELDEPNEKSSAGSSSPPAAPTSPQATTSNAVVRVNGEGSNHSHPAAAAAAAAAAATVMPQPRLNYDNCNLDEITVRQLYEDIDAYNHDLSFCQAQLAESDLTPQESRTLQLRTLDLSHQIRHCQHRIEILRVQMRGRPLRGGAFLNSSLTNGTSAPSNPSTSNKPALKPLPSSAGNKRSSTAHQDEITTLAKRPKTSSPGPVHTNEASSPTGFVDNSAVAENLSLQRLGYWKCRLCEAPRYLLAPAGRTPAMPCKWPLKDISKMITHFTEMHTEHPPSERCVELGTALAKNRGPFEYWLRRTRAQNVGDGSCIEECIVGLLEGKMPAFLRGLSRAAAGMPDEM